MLLHVIVSYIMLSLMKLWNVHVYTWRSFDFANEDLLNEYTNKNLAVCICHTNIPYPLQIFLILH